MYILITQFLQFVKQTPNEDSCEFLPTTYVCILNS
jgi:hypothetical protein